MIKKGNIYQILEKKDESLPDKNSIIQITEIDLDNVYYKILKGNYFYTCRFKKDSQFLNYCKELTNLPDGHPDKVNTTPEYVELVKDWSVDNEYVGEIFELHTLDNLSKFKSAPSKEKFREYIIKWIKDGCFKPSTKEAYDMQNKPKSLVGRYVKRLNYDITSCNVGDYLIILNDHIDYLIIEKYGRLEKYDLNHWELMPEGFEPIKVEEEWIPKIGDWVTVKKDADCFGNDAYNIRGKTFQITQKVTKEGFYGLYCTGYANQFPGVFSLSEGGIYIKYLRPALPHEIPYTGGIDPIKSNNTNLSYYKYRVYIDERTTYKAYKELYAYIKGIKQVMNSSLLEYASIDKLTKKQFLDIIEGTYYTSIEGDFLEEKSDEFVLPESWVIKITEDNINICKKYDVLNKRLNYNYTIGAYYGNKSHGNWNIPEFATEITFEQFKKYVLKEDIMSIINHECKVNIDENRSFNTFKQVSHLLTETVKLYKETSLIQQSLKTELELIPIKKLKTFNN